MQNSHTLMWATCSRISMAVSAGSSSCLSSLEIFATNMPKPAGMRAYTTFTGVGTLPNCFFDIAYAIFWIRPCGFSMGTRNVSIGEPRLHSYGSNEPPVTHFGKNRSRRLRAGIEPKPGFLLLLRHNLRQFRHRHRALQILQQPGHILAQRLHGRNALFVHLHIANLTPDPDVPVRRTRNDHFVNQKEMIQRIEGVDRPRPPH